MELVVKQLSELHPNEKNVRKHGSAQINEFKRSITKFGIIRPIVCDEKGNILAGNGLYEALVSLGKESAECVVMTGLSETDKYKLMLADNKIYSLGIDDYQNIDSIMQALAVENDFDVPGYNEETLEELYGIKSVEKAVDEQETKAIPVEDAHPFIPVVEPKPNKAVIEAKQEAQEAAKRFIICPYCGGRIDL